MASVRGVPLQGLLDGDLETVASVETDLRRRGWALVELTRELSEAVTDAREPLEAFFGKKETYKTRFAHPPIFGFVQVPHKQSLRVLTGERLQEQRLPQECGANVRRLAALLDTAIVGVAGSLLQGTSLFPIIGSVNALGRMLDLPLLQEGADKPFAMLDVAYYLNDRIPGDGGAGTLPPMNCVEHYDPGLFSLSVLSTEAGLQLYDQGSDEWVDAPAVDGGSRAQPIVAVLWSGTAAVDGSKGAIKPAIHRVQYPKEAGRPRMSMWLELCTAAQEHSELLGGELQDIDATDIAQLPKNIYPLARAKQQEGNALPSAAARSVAARKLSALEFDIGVPPSKVAPVFHFPVPSSEATKPSSKDDGSPAMAGIGIVELELGVPPSKVGPDFLQEIGVEPKSS